MKEVRIIISGRVHGVNFRYFTYRKAKALGLKGFVRNLPNRKVEVVAQGQEEKLKELVEYCRKGPLFARVDSHQVHFEKPTKKFENFEIKF